MWLVIIKKKLSEKKIFNMNIKSLIYMGYIYFK